MLNSKGYQQWRRQVVEQILNLTLIALTYID